MKGNKSFTKRLKVTRTGKVIARRPGQDHFNAKEAQKHRLARRRTTALAISKRISRRFLP